MSQCKHCSSQIDPRAAEAAADLHEKIHQAGFDAAMLKQAAIWMPVSLLLMFVPVVGMVGLFGYFVLLVAVPVLFIRWWTRFHGIPADAPDYRSSKNLTLIALGVWGIFALLTAARFVSRLRRP